MTRFGYVMTTYFTVLSIDIAALFSRTPRLIWNASASAPIGLYGLHKADTLQVGDLVAVMPPKNLAAFLEQRRYLPKGVPMLKHVEALPGQKVCRQDRKVIIDGKVAAWALWRDRFFRPLPVWEGCRVLAAGEVFLLNPRWDSLDSRYFGPVSVRIVIGRAAPLYTDRDGNGRFRWRASAP